MVDFKKLREEKKQPAVVHPIEIFRRLPKPAGINDIYTSQAQVLNEWFDRRTEQDIVIKLHTGGGKTLVGLLIAQSVLNELREPVLYLCSTRQLVAQTIRKSEQYAISAIQYETGGGSFPEEFLAGRKVLVSTYEALFNGKSKFGVTGRGNEIQRLGAIILDDAHVAYSRVRDAFTIKIRKDKRSITYHYLTNLFRQDFASIGKKGSFDDTVSGNERYSVLEVPYWSWKAHFQEVQEHLRKEFGESNNDDLIFSWPLVRDSFEYSHVLITENSFVITPYYPVVDLIPSFSDCPRRVYMSATIADDSAIIRTFDAKKASVGKPITSTSLAGVSERMILIPEWTNVKDEPFELVRRIVKWASEQQQISTVILSPSWYAAETWEKVAQVAEKPDEIVQAIHKLTTNQSKGPYAFANRYDGIDLPGDACRLLVFSNMPRGTNEYENYLAQLFEGSVLNNTLAQKIEQGIGRGARGSGDYCVVLLVGKDVLSWVVRPKNARFLTKITRAQLEIGMEISKSIESPKDLVAAIRSCLQREDEWVKYHAETLADLTDTDPISVEQLDHAEIERKALRFWRDGEYEKAVNRLVRYCESCESLDEETKGWLLQFAARIAFFGGKQDLSQSLQRQAFACSRNLFRPQAAPSYTKLMIPSDQASAILSPLGNYRIRKGYLAKFEEIVSHLVPEASSNQFEQALADLGKVLGFSTERPEKAYGLGPDVLWLLNDQVGLIIEAKSMKEKDNPLTKEEYGQLLTAEQWFLSEYPGYSSFRISVHPNRKTTERIAVRDTRVLTFEKLNQMIANSRQLLTELCDTVSSVEELGHTCQELLGKYKLTAEDIPNHYLETFE